MNRELLEAMFDEGVRVGAVIHVAGACADTEAPSNAMRAFLEEECFADGVVASFSTRWPKYPKFIADLGEDDLDEWQLEEAAGFFLRNCPATFLVCIEYQVKRCLSPDKEYPLGGWAGGWGHYAMKWLLADDVEQACAEGLAVAQERSRAEWERAKKEQPA